MVNVLIVISVLAGVVGLLLLSNATAGVGVICIGVLAAILARIAQAEAHNDALRRDLGEELRRVGNKIEESAKR